MWPFRRRSNVDPEALMAEIAKAFGGEYSREARYAEFRQVFLGTEQGKRVLYQVLAWSHLWGTSFNKDPYITAFKEGERNVGLQILATLQLEPKPRPGRARSKPTEE